MPLPECTDLPPLALAIVVLEETLVVGHTVLTEHEAKRSQSVSIMYSNMAGWQVPVAASIAIGPRTSREEIRWAHSQDRVCARGIYGAIRKEDVPSHAGASSTEHFRGWKRRRSGDVRYDVGKIGM